MPKKLCKALERLREVIERVEEEDSPSEAPGHPNGATAAPRDPHSTRECPYDARNTHQVKSSTQSRYSGPGGRNRERIGLVDIGRDLKHGTDGDSP